MVLCAYCLQDAEAGGVDKADAIGEGKGGNGDILTSVLRE